MKNSQNPKLPANGLSRASQLLPFLPFGRTTLWKLSKEDSGFPKPIKLSATMTAWDNSEIHAWLNAKKNDRGGANT